MSSLSEDPVFTWVTDAVKPSPQEEEENRREDHSPSGVGGSPPEEPQNDDLA